MSKSVPIDSIVVADRHRKDMGDLDTLAESIRSIGLLHPPVVTPEYRLVAGQRRLEACRRLGWTEMPVTVAANLSDAYALLTAERDENTCRQDMTPSEKVALGKALEALERPRAEARRRDGNRLGGLGGRQVEEKISSTSKKPPQTRDIVGKAVGMSGPIYQRAKAIVEASEDESLPEDVRAKVQEARAKMDKDGNVTGPYNEVAELIGRTPTKSPAPKKTSKDKQATRSPRRIGPGANERRIADFERAVTTLVEVCVAAEYIAVPGGISPERVAEVVADLKRAVNAVHQFRRRIEEAKS